MRLRGFVGLALLALCIAGCIGVWRVGSMLIAREPRQVLAVPADLPFESVKLEQVGGPDLAGWVADRKGSCGAIVLLHGRGANRLAVVQRAKLLFDAGYSVVLFDLSGHGESGGTVQGFGYTEGQDAARILTYAHQRFPGQKLGALGSSLGAASLLFATPQTLADAYVLEQLYATLRETTAWRMPFNVLRGLQADVLLAQMPVRLGFSADDVRPVDRIGQIGRPLILLAGTVDPFIDRGQVTALHDATPGAELVWFEGAGHVDLLRYDQQRYTNAVLPFLSKNLCQPGSSHG